MTDQPPTPEQQQGAAQVGAAAASAAADAQAAGQTAEQARSAAQSAARETAQQVRLELSEEDVRRIADMTVNVMEARGAFEPPPEPVHASPTPAQQVAPPAPGEKPVVGEPVQPAQSQAPRKRSFADKFLNG